MRKTYFLLFVFLPSVISIFAQYQITGSVKDAINDEPLEFANVFFANTMIGTTCDKNGNYVLENIPAGTHELVVSYLGYEDHVQKIVVSKWMTKKVFPITLKPRSVDLQVVEVKALTGKKRIRNLKKFENALLGKTANANRAKIINPQVVDIQLDRGELSASATDLLLVENKALGYQLKFLLEKFSLKGKTLVYSGKPLFEEMIPSSAIEKKQWEINCLETYLGSSRHFYEALVNDKLEEEGFQMFIARSKPNKGFHPLGETFRNNILFPQSNKKDFYLKFSEFLQVVYFHEKKNTNNRQLGNIASGLGHPAESDLISQSTGDVKEADQYKTSYLFSRKEKMKIAGSGRLLEPELMIEYGAWSEEGLADLLPYDYFPKEKKGKVKSQNNAPTKKGFQLTNLKIPLDEIKDGGPPRDGIPSIDRPKFLTSDAVTFLNEKDRVLGINYNGIAKAFPIMILDRHEIVNDKFDDEPVAITFCPLCGSGIGIKARVNGVPRSFGVSGLLYNSDVLLYDRESESLWSQILGEGVSGKEAGTTLDFLPTENTTWGAWKKRFPNSLVLSTETGYSIDYPKSGYQEYLQSQKLMFPVAHSDGRLKNKDKIIGIEVDGKFKAYTFKKIKKEVIPIKDTFNGKALLIYFDKKNNSARIEDEEGNVLPAVTMFWFAWVAFHSKTEVYK